MALFKAPTFQDRTALAQAAKQKALDQLRSRPPVDAAVLAQRQAAALAKDAAALEARRVKAAAREQAKIEGRKLAQERALAAAAKPEEVAAKQKSDRDARYAARKNRK